MSLEAKVDKHESDIKELTINVVKLAGIVEHSEKDRQQDRDTMKDVAKSLSVLSEKIQGLIGIEKEITQCLKEIATVRHDLASTQTTLTGLTPVLERAAKLEAKMEALETLRDRMAGGAAVIGLGAKIFWAICGGGILLGIGFILKLYFQVDLDVGGMVNGY